MQRIGLCTAVLLLAGCAAQTAAPDTATITEERVRYEGVMDEMILTSTDPSTRVTIPASREEVWQLLPGAYAAAGLPEPTLDAAQWVGAVQQHTVRRTLGRQRLATFLECGRTMTGDRADTDRIRLSVWTWVEGEGTSSTVRSRVEATATAVDGTSGSFTCTSRGELEARIAAALREAAAR